MKKSRGLAFAFSGALALGVVLATPIAAQASPQSAFGTTIDVQVSGPGTPSVLSGTTYVHVSSATTLFVTIGAAQSSAVDATWYDSNSNQLATCQIPSGSTSCGFGSVQLVTGSQSGTIVASMGAESHTYTVTFFGVTPEDSSQTQVGLEWQDAEGTWHEGAGVATFMIANQMTQYRFWIRNNTNAPIQLTDFAPNGVPQSINVIVQPGQKAYFTGTPGLASTVPTSIGAGFTFFDAAGYGNGNGNGGGLAVLSGQASLSNSSADPGDSVTLTGSQFTDQNLSAFDVSFNSTPVPLGSVLADQNGSFSLTFTVPAGATAGLHHVVLYSGTYAVAALPISIAGLADTGVNAIPYLIVAGVLFVVGIAFLVIRMFVRRRSENP
ncbi:MAG: LPXTG cell wall anchor domain-containing protein [Cryobacterium sp.]|nr:LPXTG cell wall anchor domain-containing protein [Cryobacterium sp.]MBX3103510.1 LPXTG cell wall anchor domain-containing protein [Cryobacterium sp.]